MISLKAYQNLFIAAIVLQIAFFWTGFSSTIVTVLFFTSTFALVFSRDAKVENQEDLLIPEVHYYQKEHLNTYGFAMVGMLIAGSFVFYLATSLTSIPLGIASLLLWIIMILGTRKIKELFSEDLGKDAIIDFIYLQLGGTLDDLVIDSTVSALWQEKIYTDVNKVQPLVNSVPSIPDELKALFAAAYLEYMPLILDDSEVAVYSDEIRALNEQSQTRKKKSRFKMPGLKRKKKEKKKPNTKEK